MESAGLGLPLMIGAWRVDPALDEISKDGRRVKLEPRMMRLLCTLAERPGDVFSANELLERVWAGVIVGQSSVYQAIGQLRRQLGDLGSSPSYIATVPRKGYRLIATVAPVALPVPDAVPATTVGRAGLRTWAGTVVVVLVVGLLAWVLVSRWQDRNAPAIAVAVMPFEDLTQDGSNAPFCDGLTEEIVSRLALVPGIRVTGRNSTLQLRNQAMDSRGAGQLLGVTHLVQGSVRRSNGRFRVTVRLTGTTDGFELWSNTYDRRRSDLIGLQTQIAAAIVASLELQLSHPQQARLERPPTRVVNAYEMYLLGRYQQLQRNPEALTRAIEYFQDAIASDPLFALPHAGLADAYMARFYYDNHPLEQAAALVQAEVDTALKLDPELPEAYAARAVLRTEQWRTAEAIADLQRAIAINPSFSEALLRLGAAYEYSGQPREALATFDQLLALDPLSTILHVRRCLVLQNLARYRDATAACNRAFELQPDIPNALWASALNAYAQGDLLTAIDQYRRALERAPHRMDIRNELVLLYLDLGLYEIAETELEAGLEFGTGAETTLTYARLRLVTGNPAGVINALGSISDGRTRTTARQAAEAARLLLAAGDVAGARTLADPLLESRSEVSTVGLYATRWGLCEGCSLALLTRQAGNVSLASKLEGSLLEQFAQIEDSGHRWHGLDYLRATLFAQQGQDKRALEHLRRAVDNGWRRAWLIRADPALQHLSRNPAFSQMLQQVDSANAQARDALAARTAAPAP